MKPQIGDLIRRRLWSKQFTFLVTGFDEATSELLGIGYDLQGLDGTTRAIMDKDVIILKRNLNSYSHLPEYL